MALLGGCCCCCCGDGGAADEGTAAPEGHMELIAAAEVVEEDVEDVE